MRIGIDAHFLERHYGGLTTFLKGILRTLINTDFERMNTDKKFEYYLFFQYHRPVKLTKLTKLTKYLSTYRLSKLNWLRWFHFLLPQQLKKHNIDLFFSPNHFLPFKKTTKKEIVVIHDLAWKINPEWKNLSYRIYADIFQGKVIQRANKIIVDSENTKKDVMKYYGGIINDNDDDKIEIAYLAANEEFKPRITTNYESKYEYTNLREVQKKYNLPPKFILYIGRIERRKNIQGIIEIAKKIRKLDRFKELKFILFGPIGPGGNQYLDIIRDITNIQYKGIAEGKDLPYIYNLAKIFLFPSFYEGFGIPVLEAMQSGIPVLASNTSSLPEVVGKGGLMHDPEDYQGFTRDIQRLLGDDKFYQEMRKKGVEQAKKFNWEKTTKKLVAIFNKT